VSTTAPTEDRFRHDALFYEGVDGFVDGVGSFIREGVLAREPVMVAVDQEKIDLLRTALGSHARDVEFVDMNVIGANPARILSAWDRFVNERGRYGRHVRGVGEPVWPDRSAAELVECEIHEQLLNVAFAGGQAWSLLCPYDASTLSNAALESARRTHPFVDHGHERVRSDTYLGDREGGMLFERQLPAPSDDHLRFPFGADQLVELRRLVMQFALDAGFSESKTADAVLAVHEMAANSVLHGGGSGVMRLWTEGGALVCEISDRGRIRSPLAGRRRPSEGQIGGRGLWMVTQLTDLVQVRSGRSGSTVRVLLYP
jgi:anti-sigma regulatory factor (Ser/Thr protein kinase)